MSNSKLVLFGFIHALGVGVYVAIVATFMRHGEQIFGKMNNLLGPMAFLLMFVLSAAVTSALVLGRPILFYLDNKKAEAVKLFGYTLGWLFVLIAVILITAAII